MLSKPTAFHRKNGDVAKPTLWQMLLVVQGSDGGIKISTSLTKQAALVGNFSTTNNMRICVLWWERTDSHKPS